MNTVILSSFPKKATIKDLKSFFKGTRIVSVENWKNGDKKITFRSEFHTENALKLNNTKFKDKCVSIKLYERIKKKKSKSVKEKTKETSKSAITEKLSDEIEKEILETGRLYVKKVDFSSTEEDFIKLFLPFGNVTEVLLPIDQATNKPYGYGIVSYDEPSNAVKAYKSLNGKKFITRKIFITAGKVKAVSEKIETRKSNYKKEKLEQLKSKSKSSFNWNHLFVNSDAVTQFLAHENGVTIVELHEAFKYKSMSVSLAQAEVLFINLLRDFLVENNIDVDNIVNSRLVSRNNPGAFVFYSTTFLVKNLNFGTLHDELEDVFKKYKGFVKLKMAKHGVLALVTYDNSRNTDNAFLETMNMKFKDTFLHLQWVPMKKIEKSQTNTNKTVTDNRKRKLDQNETMPEASEPKMMKESHGNNDPSVKSNSKKILIKNIPFQSTYKDLSQLFKEAKGLMALRLPKKPLGGHKGYAFLEFESEKHAQMTMEEMGKGIHLLGRRLVFQYALI